MVFERGVGSMLNGGSQMHMIEDFLDAASSKIRPLLLAAAFQYGLRDSVSDPGKWIKRLGELPAEQRLNATNGLAQGWAQNDPEAAANWVLSLPEGQQRDTAFSPIASTWAGHDPQGAANWVNSLPAGKDRDIATQGIVAALSESQPDSAWTWALSIGSEEQRFHALQLAYMGMQRKNPDAASQLIQNAKLSPREAEALRKIGPR
jgi:hypothetical protein